jgi:hypothetical protein
MDGFMDALCGCLPKRAKIAPLYFRKDDWTTRVVQVVPALFVADFRGEGMGDIVVGYLRPSPTVPGAESLSVALLRFESYGFKKIWDYPCGGAYFAPPHYLTVYDFNGDGRLEIVMDLGSGVSNIPPSGPEIYQWDPATSSVVRLPSMALRP